MSEAALRVHRVTKRFGGLVAVNEVSFDITGGEICALIGPNGAGKSTLFNLVAGEANPTSGSIRLFGREIAGLRAHAIARLGLGRTFQLVHLFPSLSVGENVLVGAERGSRMGWLENVVHARGFRARLDCAIAGVERALDLAGIAHLAGRPVHTLSYGQQRLVAVARAMAAEPRLLLLDEPGAGLSETELGQLRTAILGARDRGMTVLVVEHNVPFVMALADRVVVLDGGITIAAGEPRDVQENPAVLEAYLGR